MLTIQPLLILSFTPVGTHNPRFCSYADRTTRKIRDISTQTPNHCVMIIQLSRLMKEGCMSKYLKRFLGLADTGQFTTVVEVRISGVEAGESVGAWTGEVEI